MTDVISKIVPLQLSFDCTPAWNVGSEEFSYTECKEKTTEQIREYSDLISWTKRPCEVGYHTESIFCAMRLDSRRLLRFLNIIECSNCLKFLLTR
jgi:hypothetical protein